MPGTRRRTAMFVSLMTAVLLIAIAVLWYLFEASDREGAGSLIQSMAAVIVPAGAAGWWLWQKYRGPVRREDRAGPDAVDRAADLLASAVRIQWEAAAAERRLLVPAPVPVRWRWAEGAVTGAVGEAVGHGAPARFAPLPGLSATSAAMLRGGEVRELFAVYGGLGSGRLLIVGGPGAGKSSAGIRLVLDALAHRAAVEPAQRTQVPVPVLMTCHGWNPATESVQQWLTRRLAADYHLGSAAVALVRDGRVALVLDGLDELPAAARALAMRALDEQTSSLRLVVLARSREIMQAVAAGHLHEAAAVELMPVTRADAADYLRRCRVDPSLPAWRRLVDHVRECGDSVLTMALDTPLTLGLVRDTVQDEEQVTGLLVPGRFTDRRQVDDELLGRVITTAYLPRPGRAAPPYTAEQAHRWLAFLAYRMREAKTRDLAWWQIPVWTGTGPRIVATVAFAALMTLLAFTIAFGPGFGAALAAVLGPVTGLTFGRAARQPQRMRPIRWATLASGRPLRPALAAAIIGGVSGWLGGGGVWFGLGIGAAIGGAFWLGMGLLMAMSEASTGPSSPVDPMRCWRDDNDHGTAIGLVVGLLTALASAVGAWVASGAAAAVVAFVVVAPVVGLTVAVICPQAWPARLSFLQLWRTGRTPASLIRFLEWASCRYASRSQAYRPSFGLGHPAVPHRRR